MATKINANFACTSADYIGMGIIAGSSAAEYFYTFWFGYFYETGYVISDEILVDGERAIDAYS